VRELGPDDNTVLDTVFAGLSANSRYLRFHAPVTTMSGAVRRSLAAVDGHRHVALAAFAGAEPVGIVRIIGQDHGRAELAVEVVDAWQGRGVGTRLLAAARDRAVQLGHRALVAGVLAENTAMRAVLRRVFPTARTRLDGAELTITLPVAVDEPTDRVTRIPA
jgi:GNAT superfamily N-acetyltransferase